MTSGSGYSSLYHLKNLPVSTLKIDTAFVQNLPASKMTRRSCGRFSRWVKTLTWAIVAEGIENEEQRSLLINRRLPLRAGLSPLSTGHNGSAAGRTGPLSHTAATASAGDAAPGPACPNQRIHIPNARRWPRSFFRSQRMLLQARGACLLLCTLACRQRSGRTA